MAEHPADGGSIFNGAALAAAGLPTEDQKPPRLVLELDE